MNAIVIAILRVRHLPPPPRRLRPRPPRRHQSGGESMKPHAKARSREEKAKKSGQFPSTQFLRDFA